MLFSNVSILGVRHIDAPQRVTSRELEARFEPALRQLGVAPGLLETLTGVRSRGFWDLDVPPSHGAAEAGRAALHAAGVRPDEIGLLINTSVCRDYIEPSTASIVHAHLGLPSTCANFDLSNACLGFLTAMDLAATWIERGAIRYALIVDGENAHPVVDHTVRRFLGHSFDRTLFRRHFATLTLGSGAAAMVLGAADRHPGQPTYTGSVQLTDSSQNHLCRGQVDGMETDTTGLMQAGIALATHTGALAARTFGWTPSDDDAVILHQVSRPHTDRVTAALALNPAHVHILYPEYGNVGPTSIPILLSRSLASGALGPGARARLLGIGSGLNCAMGEIRF
jgi:3-oxoacyl-[acyl-carrier-protein] synthase III